MQPVFLIRRLPERHPISVESSVPEIQPYGAHRSRFEGLIAGEAGQPERWVRRGRDPRAGCPPAQPQERRRHHPPQQAGGVHRCEWQRQELTRLRHDFCRGSASLRRKSVRLRPSVPGSGGQAGCGCHRRAFTGHLDRSEIHQPQSPLHGRHRHRDSGLPAPAVRSRW